VILGAALVLGEGPSAGLHERSFAGKAGARDKIAVIKIDGVLMEGLLSYDEKQIEQAATDKHVKAVILRINSPGGSVSASEHLYRRLLRLRDGDPEKNTDPKPLIVSMQALAASGGYYIAMAARPLLAEPTTETGSIGVYAALPNVEALGEKIGFNMRVFKAGEVKDSGSPFRGMTPKEEELWQNTVDHTYLHFLNVVETGRPELFGKLQKDLSIEEDLPVRTTEGEKRSYRLTRYRADGGLFTAEQALKYGLIDRIGYLEDAIDEAKKQANLTGDYRVVEYDRPQTLLGLLFGVKSPSPGTAFDARALSSGATPRLWYLAPQCEAAGLLATLAP
jgi:protease-4